MSCLAVCGRHLTIEEEEVLSAREEDIWLIKEHQSGTVSCVIKTNSCLRQSN